MFREEKIRSIVEKRQMIEREMSDPCASSSLDHGTLGQIWLPREGEGLVFVLAALVHPVDRAFVCLCPIDQRAWLGVADVRAANEARSQADWSVRCGRSVWVKAALLPRLAVNTGMRVPDPEIDRVQERLSELACGTLAPSAEQVVTESDPDYEQWMGESVTATALCLRTAHQMLLAD